MKSEIQQLLNKNLITQETANILLNRDKLILNILSDGIIFEKMSAGVNAILQAYSANTDNFDAENYHQGVSVALSLIGVGQLFDDDELRHKLWNIYQLEIEDEQTKKTGINSKEMAKIILIKWKAEIEKQIPETKVA